MARVEMDDMQEWPDGLSVVLAADAEDFANLDPRFTAVDFYTNSGIQYSEADDAYFMFPSAYYHFSEDDNDGVLDTQIAVSRNGVTWNRPDRTPYVPLGGDGLGGDSEWAWDSGMVMMGPGMVRMGDKIYQYYCGTDFTHGGTRYDSPEKEVPWGHLALVEQRLDGFYSADVDANGGWLQTPELIFAGGRLVLNIDASAGSALVAIVDAAGNPLPGFGLDDCDVIQTDDVGYTVTWNGQWDVSSLDGVPVGLLFEMQSTKLYAFQFQPAPMPGDANFRWKCRRRDPGRQLADHE